MKNKKYKRKNHKEEILSILRPLEQGSIGLYSAYRTLKTIIDLRCSNERHETIMKFEKRLKRKGLI